MIIPKVSVVITSYNIEKYIEDCVGSILTQTLNEIEVICVDDNSADRTYDVLCDMKKKDDRIKLYKNKNNSGLAISRVKGYELALGKYVYIMDGDDLLKPEALKVLFELSEKNELDLLSFSGQSFFDDNDMLEKYSSQSDCYIRKGVYSQEAKKGTVLFAEYMKNGDMCGNMVFQFFRKAIIKKKETIGIEGIRYGESPLDLYVSAKRAMCIPNILYLRRFRKQSDITTPFDQVKFESIIVQYNYDYTLFCTMECSDGDTTKWISRYLYIRLREIVSKYSCIKFELNKTKILPEFPQAAFFYENIVKRLNGKDMYCELLDKNVIDSLKKEERIIIYGNGKVASYVVEKLKNNEISNFYIATTEGRKTKNGDILEYSIDDLKKYRDASIVIIAVAWDKKGRIKEILNCKGFKRLMEVSKG